MIFLVILLNINYYIRPPLFWKCALWFKRDNKILNVFKLLNVNKHLRACMFDSKKFYIKDLNKFIEVFNSILEDVNKFLLTYIYNIVYFSNKLSKKDFDLFIDRAYKKYLGLAQQLIISKKYSK